MREMKNSGIEWIGEIPANWEVKKFKHVADIYTGNSIKDEEKSMYEDPNEAVPYIATKDIKSVFNTVDYGNGIYIKNDDLSFVRAYSGDTLMCIEGGSAGKKKARIDRTVCFVNKLCCFHATAINSDFLYYILNSPNYEEEFMFNITGLIGGVSKNKLMNFVLPFPSLPEQHRIADFLDERCAKIDAVIEKQKQVIEKLKEYKLSVITEAVTKGLDPTVPMKDSGVEWIGEIPEGWKVRKLRYLGSCINGISKGGEYFGRGYPFVSYGDVYKNIQLPKQVNGLVDTTEKERGWYSVKEGDVFFTRTSETIEEVALTSTCMQTIENATFAGFLIRFRPDTDLLVKEFSKYYFRSTKHRAFFVKEMNLVTRASLSQELLKRFPVLLPPVSEQMEISKYLDQKCSEIDSAISKKQAIVENLTEYKKSLIYEVVTGKREV